MKPLNTIVRSGVILGLLTAPALAHKDVTVTICIPDYRGGPCAEQNAPPAYRHGKRVTVKGRTEPTHAGTVQVQRKKGDQDWKVVAKRKLEGGRYRYGWQTERDDADQNTPYKFRVKMPNHDISRVQRVYVHYGE